MQKSQGLGILNSDIEDHLKRTHAMHILKATTIALLSLAAITAPATAQQWSAEFTANGDTYYLDQDSFRRDGDRIQYDVLTWYAAPDDAVAANINNMYGDCRTNQIQLQGLTAFSATGDVLFSEPVTDDPVRTVQRGTLGHSLLQRACGNQ